MAARMFFFEKKNQKTCNCLGKEGKRQKAKARMFFFEKKNQKTFVYWLSLWETAGVIGADANRQKFFGSFFQKRTFFLPLALPTWAVTKTFVYWLSLSETAGVIGADAN